MDSSDTPSPKYAGFIIRFCAFLIDTLVIFIAVNAVAFIIFSLGDISFIDPELVAEAQYYSSRGLEIPDEIRDAMRMPFVKFIFVIAGAVFLFYWTYSSFMDSEGHKGSIGKKLLRLRVVDKDGCRPKLYKSAGRALVKYLQLLIFSPLFAAIAFNKKKQGIHDKIFRTYVVYSRKSK
ncbi:putative membrane protein YckC [Parelusimicrobium proximum]|uniref:RDD family protein n=1 Tax=Parelusimicrobium proximum TaxID=3228953 RepID=UPI003D176B2C